MKRYDRSYFDRWYRDPRHRVTTPAALGRKVSAVLGLSEYLLDQPVRSVLDVGCGEGAWCVQLRRLRPSAYYAGIDPSEYVVERYGRARNIRLGGFADLAALSDLDSYDLVVCCDVIQYLPTRELRTGVAALGERLSGVAFLEAYTTADELGGDKRDWRHRSPQYFRRLFRSAGLVSCGIHCYVGADLARDTVVLERA